MTTYELPPEPEVGSRVRDHDGRVWTLSHAGWQSPDHTTTGSTWGSLLAYSAPLTLIEPDPWPTAPLIVADMGGKRELFSRNVEGAYESSTFYVDSDTIEPFTNVVPVTVVPVADLDALARASRAVGSPGLPDSLQDRVIRLLEATDALGLDQ